MEEDTVTDSVGGRPRPDNVVSSTLIVEGAMMLRSTVSRISTPLQTLSGRSKGREWPTLREDT